MVKMTSSNEEEWITQEEKELVVKLRELVQNELPSSELSKSQEDQDAFLLRWLRARSLNLEKAKSMLLEGIQWRKDNNVSTALDRAPDPFFMENYIWTYVGKDKAGHPVAIASFRDWDFRKITADKTDDFDFFVRHYFETVMKGVEICNRQKKDKHPVTQFFPVLDVNNYPYGQMLSFGAMRKWFQMAATYEAYYPEVLFKAAFINAPFYFQYFLNMFKGIFAPRTLAKITCYGTLEDWKKDMVNYMDPAILPVKYGGTCDKELLETSIQSRISELDNIFAD